MRLCLESIQFPLQDLLHQHNTATRRVGFLAEHLVGRASGEAETAMNARLDRFGHILAMSSNGSNVDVV